MITREALPLSLESTLLFLQNKIVIYKSVLLVIDGLEKYEEETVKSLIYEVIKLLRERLAPASQYPSDIDGESPTALVTSTGKARNMDTGLLIDYQVQRNRNLRHTAQRAPGLQQDIKSVVVKTTGNSFLLARLHVESPAPHEASPSTRGLRSVSPK